MHFLKLSTEEKTKNLELAKAVLQAETNKQLKDYRIPAEKYGMRIYKSASLDDWTTFAKATKLKAAALKKVRPFITEKDPSAQPIEGEPDVDLRDTENIPFTYAGGVDAFMKNEVLTYAPDAWVDEKKTQVGYEISFTKYFYKPVELRDMSDILSNLSSLEQEADGLLAEIMGGVR